MRQSRRRYAASAKAKLQATDINYLGHKTRQAHNAAQPASALIGPQRLSLFPTPRWSILLSIHSTTARYGNRGRKTGTRRTRSPVFSSNNRPPRPSLLLPPLRWRHCSEYANRFTWLSNSGFFSVETVIKSSTTDARIILLLKKFWRRSRRGNACFYTWQLYYWSKLLLLLLLSG